MGALQAMELAEDDFGLGLETTIGMHLRGNHYPPVPAEMVTPCIEAIDAAYDEDYNRMIDMPMVGDFQITYKGSKQAPAWAIIEQHHLSWFIDPQEDYDE